MKCSDVRLEKEPDTVEEQIHQVDIYDEETKETTTRNVIRRVVIKGEEIEVKCPNRVFTICAKCDTPLCEAHYIMFNFDRSKHFCEGDGRSIEAQLKELLEKLAQ